MYSEEWVERLYRGFARNLTVPFEFVCYTTNENPHLGWHIRQKRIHTARPTYADCIQPYELNTPMILVGLDTVVTGNCDALAEYCFTQNVIALPRDPFDKRHACNGVALVPKGWRKVFDTHGDQNDMEWLRSFPHNYIDDWFPGAVASYKGEVRQRGLKDTRIVYFHGNEKPHQLGHLPWVKEHWR